MITNDAALMQQCCNGSLEKFTIIYERYFKKIYTYVFFKTLHRESAEDITSQTFMQALEKIKSYDSSRAGVATWLFKIASNIAVDYYRKSKNNISIDELYDLKADENIESALMDKELLSQVMSYFKTLPEKKREIIILRVWQNMPYRDIARITGASEASCKMNFYRAIEEIRAKVPAGLAVTLVLKIATAVSLCAKEVII